jgi:hypothetical protein
MKWLRNWRAKTAAIFAVIIAVLAVGVGIAYASIPASGGTIDGCYKTSNPGQGALIVIDSSATCPSGTTALNWNQTGPQGPAGPSGVSGYVVEHQTFTVYGVGVSGTGLNTDVFCPSGDSVLGGGYDVYSAPNISVVASRPVEPPQSSVPGWRLSWNFSAFTGQETYDIWATCAVVSS